MTVVAGSDFDTGLASDFVNFVKARGRSAWVCTDKGLSTVDWDTNHWVTYAPSMGPTEYGGPWEARIYEEGQLLATRPLAKGLANNFVLGVDFQDDRIWVATGKGVSRGTLGEGAGSEQP